jgi:O-antigen/teichoic acid export membrane protein
MVITAILARRLGLESFGLYIFIQWLIDMAFLIYSVGLNGVATRFYPQSVGIGVERLPGFNRWFLRAGLLAICLATCFASLSAIIFANIGGVAHITIVTFLAATTSIYGLFGSRAQGLFQFKRFAASVMVFAIVALVGLSLPQQVSGLFGAFLVLAIANLAATACLVAGRSSGVHTIDGLNLSKAHSDLISQYAMNGWLSTMLASFVWGRGEISLVKGYLGATAVGYYSAGLTISGIINQGMALLAGALWPQIARSWDTGDREELSRFSGLVTDLLILAAGILAGFVICFAPYITSLLFGDKFIQSTPLIMILALGALGLSSGCANLVIQAATNGKFSRNVTLAGAIILFGAMYLLIPRFGIVGAAVVRISLQIGIAILTLVWAGKVLGHNRDVSRNLKYFLMVLTSAVALVIILRVMPVLLLWGHFVLFLNYCFIICLISLRIWMPNTINKLRELSEI